MTIRGGRLRFGIAGLAILVFATLLVFALIRLFATEEEMRRNLGDNMLWAISRAEVSALSLDSAVARHVAAPDEDHRIAIEYSVLLSRLSLLAAGPQLRYLDDLGHAQPIDYLTDRVYELEPVLATNDAIAPEAARDVHEVLQPLAKLLGRAANDSMVAHWETTGGRLDDQRAAINQIILSIPVIILLGIYFCYAMIRAMIDRQRIERSLLHEQEIREAYRSFVSLVSHQFRTPLAVIDSAMQRLIRRGTGADVEARAGTVRQEVRKLSQLINNTLDAIRLEAGQLCPAPQGCDIAELVRLVRVRQLDATPGRAIELDLARDLPASVETDPLFVEQILSNLLSNAVKYSPDGQPVRVTAWAGPLDIFIAVEDRGVGIPEAEQGRLFESFFRASSSDGVPGSGVGLHVSRQLADLIGGTLRVLSRSGAGSTFTLVLPRTWPQKAEPAEEKDRADV